MSQLLLWMTTESVSRFLSNELEEKLPTVHQSTSLICTRFCKLQQRNRSNNYVSEIYKNLLLYHKLRLTVLTRCSAASEGPRDAPGQLNMRR